MSGYRPGYSELHSPYYRDGQADGQRDEQRVKSCPPRPPLGMDSAKERSAMYRRGYESMFTGRRHSCGNCRQGSAA